MNVPQLRATVVGLLAFCAAPFVMPTPSQGQPPAANEVKADDIKKLQNIGADTCRRCHREPQPEDVRDKITDFLRLDEFSTWQGQDLHAKAFDVLSGPLAKQMGTALGWGDVAKRLECLACHAVNLSQELSPGIPRPATSSEFFHTKDGVGCEACHGAADKWFRPHFDKSWRTVSPEEKLTKFGERDMRDAVARADRCASCHVGNSAEGKFVTHAMFAAGHPPLPPLEVMTFGRDQPMHYIPPRDNKYINGLSDDDAWKLFHLRKGESASARQVAVGAVVGFREGMKTLEHEAGVASKKGQILDFALFECSACHHDLIVPSWRQGGKGIPGRPLPRTGPTTLLRTIAGPESSGFDARLAALVKSCDAKPFGDPAAIGPAARDLAAWSDGLAKKLDNGHFDDTRTIQLRQHIAGAARKPSPSGRALDYDDAQQLLWAFGALKDGRKPAPPAVANELAKLAGLPESNTPLLGPLWEPGKWEPGKRPLVVDTLSRRLGRVSRYQQDPATFRKAFEKIAADLGAAGR